MDTPLTPDAFFDAVNKAFLSSSETDALIAQLDDSNFAIAVMKIRRANNTTILMEATAHGHEKIVQAFLDLRNRPDLPSMLVDQFINTQTYDGWTAVMFARLHGHKITSAYLARYTNLALKTTSDQEPLEIQPWSGAYSRPTKTETSSIGQLVTVPVHF